MLIRAVFALFALCASGLALAVGTPFDQAAFAKGQQSGKPILVAVHADWCPTCRAQDPLLSDLLKRPEFKDFSAYRVDFDTQEDVVKKFKVPMQSTLLLFKGGKEVARSTGETRRDELIAFLKKAL